MRAPGGIVGRTPWSAADAPVGLLAPCVTLVSLSRLRDAGVPRGPGGPPHDAGRILSFGKSKWDGAEEALP
jgi:hypothetical protein